MVQDLVSNYNTAAAVRRIALSDETTKYLAALKLRSRHSKETRAPRQPRAYTPDTSCSTGATRL